MHCNNHCKQGCDLLSANSGLISSIMPDMAQSPAALQPKYGPGSHDSYLYFHSLARPGKALTHQLGATGHSYISGGLGATAQCSSPFEHADERHRAQCCSAVAPQPPLLIHLTAPTSLTPSRTPQREKRPGSTSVRNPQFRVIIESTMWSWPIFITMHERIPACGTRLPFEVANPQRCDI